MDGFEVTPIARWKPRPANIRPIVASTLTHCRAAGTVSERGMDGFVTKRRAAKAAGSFDFLECRARKTQQG